MSEEMTQNKSFWQLSRKIPLFITASAAVSALLIAFFAIIQFENVEEENLKGNFETLTKQRAAELTDYFKTISDDLSIVADAPMTKKAQLSFSRAWNMYDGDPKAELKRLFITENAYPMGEKHKLNIADGDKSAYGQVHKAYHPWYRKFLEQRGYYDIFMIDTKGNLVYSVFKELDYATNLNSGQWKNTDLANTFRSALKLGEGEQTFYDFKPYKPSNDAPASFIGQPIVVDGETKGVLIFQMPIDRINALIAKETNLGATGEVILVGEDRLARNQSPIIDKPTVLKRPVDGAYVRKALEGKSGLMVADLADWGEDEAAHPHFVGYAPFDFKGAKYAVVVMQEEEEAFAFIDDIRNTVLLILIVIIVGVVVVGIFLGRSIAQPISALTDLVNELAAGRVKSVQMQERGDELGEMARSLNQIYSLSVENKSIRAALDNATTCIMVANTDREIVYMNPAVEEMLRVAEADIKEALPHFDANNVLGQNIDIYHKNPQHQADVLAKLSGTHTTRLTLGVRSFDLTAAPVTDDEGNRLGSVVEWNDLTDLLSRQEAEKAVAEENYRIRAALDNATTCIMVADSDRKVVYMNPAVQHMFDVAENDIKQRLPHFDAHNVLGQSIDIYHKNPQHQADLLAKLENIHKTRMVMGQRTFDLTAAPVKDQEGKRLGSVVEWKDITAELHVQEEVDNVVRAVVNGDFTQSISLDGKEGFMEALGQSINALNDTVSDVFGEIAESLSSLAKGDLQYQITKDYSGTYETLKQDTNQTSTRLKGIVGDILVSSNEITSASKEISSGSIDLSQRTETQASSLEETAASMEQMSTTVKQNADNAQQANVLAIKARDVAEEGGSVVEQAVEAMSSIEGSSQKVSDIIGVIDEIAFQTNLLALNAAVEAARAGDAGKGFAVVASEVRTLAQRSSEAAKDIKSLILDSNQQVREGVKLVGETGGSLENIVDSIKRVADIVSEIAAASQEQASGVGEINAAITQMDEMTQQNAALVEESSASARSLEEQSEKMMQLMSYFDIGKDKINIATPVSAIEAPQPQAIAQIPQSSIETDVDDFEDDFDDYAPEDSGSVSNDAPRAGADVKADADWEEF
ncbi:putative Methyl-accepting chemotaxis sensory transducer [Candidatus Terasakiella magnetica]|uniref:Putative Methyl-accepting chemotaxis sensory transducer n=1 Tax=Candidatus Terasakiella magnetica TaxID=1867952 RepID=A0A1C3RC93_9PROT|nr:methyl-accepting chemotaxis protein [Candidatus Terasakiella magnetica]SCA54854.1 putative Methyl-accepting chemotaxis sensory transducer [Candidatus Terasakiella magnetica]